MLPIHRGRLNKVCQHYISNHLIPCEHQATGEKTVHILVFLDIQKIIVFLANYAKEYAILLPDRVCGYKSSYMQLSSSSTTIKVHIINAVLVQVFKEEMLVIKTNKLAVMFGKIKLLNLELHSQVYTNTSALSMSSDTGGIWENSSLSSTQAGSCAAA